VASHTDNANYLLVALVVTVLVHVLMWLLAANIEVPAMVRDAAVRMQRLMVSTVPAAVLEQAREEPTPSILDAPLGEPGKEAAELLAHPASQKLETRVKAAILEGAGRDLLQAPPSDEPPVPATAPPPEVLGMPQVGLPEQPLPDLERPEVGGGAERVPLSGDLVPAITSDGGNPPKPGVRIQEVPGMEMELPKRERPVLPAPTNPEDEQAPAVAPAPAPEQELQVQAEQADEPPPVNINPMIDVGVTIYRDPDTGAGYFRAELEPNRGSDKVAPIPGDWLILLDASASITGSKLREFQKGVSLALDYLKPEDRFNIVSFRGRRKAVFDDFVRPTPNNIAKARDYVNGLWSFGSTDLYGSLAPYLQVARDSDRPYQIILVSDGKSTAGEDLSDPEFLRRVSQDNTAGASIFAYSAGDDANTFLMQYLAYRNGGLSKHVSEDGNAGIRLSTFVGSYADILVAEPVATATGDLQREVYPKQLPHLYRGQPLTVHGRFGPETEQVGVLVQGRNFAGDRGEITVHAKVGEAPEGGPEIARMWAAQKIYHLLSEYAVARDPKLRKQINRLAKRYDVVVPW